jgi:hypothetical protein
MTNASNLEGLVVIVLVFIATCVHINRIKRLKQIFSTSFKRLGPLSIFHKASVIGIRLMYPISFLSMMLAIYIVVR